MTQNGLKSALWDAANTLRGSAVDRTDWKGYILPLLFFKRISDVWDEETAEAAEAFGDVDPVAVGIPERHVATPGPPAQIPASGTTALGSCLGSNATPLLRRSVQQLDVPATAH